MGVSVTFDLATFTARYPEFAAVTQQTAQLWFNEATLYQRNDGGGPVCDPTVQLMLLNMLTAHIGAISGFLNATGSPNPTAVGRLSQGSQGSVSASLEWDTSAKPGTQAWAIQTIYGAAWLQATLPYRTARYVPGPRRRNDGAWGPGRFGSSGNFR